MAHPTVLPFEQRMHLAQVVRKHTTTTVARTLGVGREQVVKLAAGIPVRAGTLALAQQALPKLDAAFDA